jgi:hypothetical protein
VLEHASEVDVHIGQAGNRHADFSIVECAHPVGRSGNILEGLFGVEERDNDFGGAVFKVENEVLKRSLQAAENLVAQFLVLPAFIAEQEVLAAELAVGA